MISIPRHAAHNKYVQGPYPRLDPDAESLLECIRNTAIYSDDSCIVEKDFQDHFNAMLSACAMLRRVVESDEHHQQSNPKESVLVHLVRQAVDAAFPNAAIQCVR